MNKKMIALLLLFTFLSSCEKKEAVNYKPHEPDITVVLNEPLIEPEVASENTVFAEPSTVEIFINGELSNLCGYMINGQNYFRLYDIALALNDTRARFSFDISQITEIHLRRGHNIDDVPPLIAETLYVAPARTEVGVLIGMDIYFTNNAIEINGDYLFLLNDINGLLGFSVDDINNTILISTNEQNLSDFGLQAAEEFLAQRYTLFAQGLSDEDFIALGQLSQPRYFPLEHNRDGETGYYFYPNFYYLYDLNHDGIPEILIHYDTPPWAMSRTLFIYEYINGNYRETGQIPLWGEIFLFRDGNGRIFSFEGNHHDGFTHVNLLTFENGILQWESLIEPFWLWREDSGWDDEDYNEWRTLWGEWDIFNPVDPQNPDVPLIAERPLNNPQTAALHETIYERVNMED